MTGVQRMATGVKPPAATRRSNLFAYNRVTSLATLEAFCRIPVDATKPDPKLGTPVMDWGKVTRREEVTATLAGREHRLLLYEVRGQRGTYRFAGDSHEQTLGILDVPVGHLVALCEEDLVDLYDLPAPWTGPLSKIVSRLKMSAPPRVQEIKHLEPLHIPDTKLRVDGRSGKLSLDPERRYLVKAKVEAADGARWDMGVWWLEVPPGIRGASLVAPGKRLYFVIEKPILEDQPGGVRPRVVVRAATVLDELFPP